MKSQYCATVEFNLSFYITATTGQRHKEGWVFLPHETIKNLSPLACFLCILEGISLQLSTVLTASVWVVTQNTRGIIWRPTTVGFQVILVYGFSGPSHSGLPPQNPKSTVNLSTLHSETGKDNIKHLLVFLFLTLV